MNVLVELSLRSHHLLKDTILKTELNFIHLVLSKVVLSKPRANNLITLKLVAH